jgi:hypothetical protein
MLVPRRGTHRYETFFGDFISNTVSAVFPCVLHGHSLSRHNLGSPVQRRRIRRIEMKLIIAGVVVIAVLALGTTLIPDIARYLKMRSM